MAEDKPYVDQEHHSVCRCTNLTNNKELCPSTFSLEHLEHRTNLINHSVYQQLMMKHVFTPTWQAQLLQFARNLDLPYSHGSDLASVICIASDKPKSIREVTVAQYIKKPFIIIGYVQIIIVLINSF